MITRAQFCLLMLAWPLTAGAQTPTCIFCHSDREVSKIRYLDGVSYPVCALCQQRLPRCSECENPTDQKPYRDGRTICAVCKATGIFTPSQAQKVQLEVQGFVRTLLGFSDSPPMQVVDKDELQTKFSEGGRSMDVAGFYRPYNPEMVYILSGKQALEDGGVLSHEYTHAWQSRNCPSQDRALTEGFASWVEYQYYQSHGAAGEANRLTRKRDPDYGASLVSLLAREQRMGRPAFLAWVRKAHDLSSN